MQEHNSTYTMTINEKIGAALWNLKIRPHFQKTSLP